MRFKSNNHDSVRGHNRKNLTRALLIAAASLNVGACQTTNMQQKDYKNSVFRCFDKFNVVFKNPDRIHIQGYTDGKSRENGEQPGKPLSQSEREERLNTLRAYIQALMELDYKKCREDSNSIGYVMIVNSLYYEKHANRTGDLSMDFDARIMDLNDGRTIKSFNTATAKLKYENGVIKKVLIVTH